MTRAHLLIPVWLAAIGAAFTSGGSPPVVGIRECPEAHYGGQEKGGPIGLHAMTSGTDGIPEFNDCQRFIVNGGYDSLYAIYATHPSTVAVGKSVGVLVAIIYSLGGTYERLGISPGFNCVYLSGDRVRARVVSVTDSGALEKCCPLAFLDQLSGRLLQSKPIVVREFPSDSDYPQVARWDWNGQVQYMGAKCGAAWCEIGPPGFQSSPAWTPTENLPYRMKRNMMIKGWYDEQLLAGARPTGSDTLGPVSGIRGTIFPSDSLADYTDATWKGHWRTVAYVALPRTSEKYSDSMNFAATPWASPGVATDPRTLNTIEVCVGSASDCRIPLGVKTSCPTVTSDTSVATWGWSRITRAKTAYSKYKCLRRWSNMGLAYLPPATSRWRWVSDDETSWTKCSAGCCEVH